MYTAISYAISEREPLNIKMCCLNIHVSISFLSSTACANYCSCLLHTIRIKRSTTKCFFGANYTNVLIFRAYTDPIQSLKVRIRYSLFRDFPACQLIALYTLT